MANHCNFTNKTQGYRANHVANYCNFTNKTQGNIAVVSTLLGKFRRCVLRRSVLYPYRISRKETKIQMLLVSLTVTFKMKKC